jgi:hypothetical protein
MFTLSRTSYPPGEIYLRNGQIVHSRVGELEGEEAVYELAIWPEGDFLFTPGRDSAAVTIQRSNTNLLMEAARRIDEWQVLSKRIPSTRLVPVFTNHATTTSVSLTPQEWALVCKMDERRSIEEIAAGLGISAFETCKLLYGLITSGLVTLKEDLSRLRTDRLQRMTPDELARISDTIHAEARARLGDHSYAAELDSTYRLGRAELEAGRGAEAVLDLVRSDEKLLAAVLGPNQSKAFLDRVADLLSNSTSR